MPEAFREWSVDAWLPRIHCPVMAIHSDRDDFVSEAFPRRIAGGVGGPSRMVLLPGCGHVPHREREAGVVGLVRDFLGAAAQAG